MIQCLNLDGRQCPISVSDCAQPLVRHYVASDDWNISVANVV